MTRKRHGKKASNTKRKGRRYKGGVGVKKTIRDLGLGKFFGIGQNPISSTGRPSNTSVAFEPLKPTPPSKPNPKTLGQLYGTYGPPKPPLKPTPPPRKQPVAPVSEALEVPDSKVLLPLETPIPTNNSSIINNAPPLSQEVDPQAIVATPPPTPTSNIRNAFSSASPPNLEADPQEQTASPLPRPTIEIPNNNNSNRSVFTRINVSEPVPVADVKPVSQTRYAKNIEDIIVEFLVWRLPKLGVQLPKLTKNIRDRNEIKKILREYVVEYQSNIFSYLKSLLNENQTSKAKEIDSYSNNVFRIHQLLKSAQEYMRDKNSSNTLSKEERIKRRDELVDIVQKVANRLKYRDLYEFAGWIVNITRNKTQDFLRAFIERYYPEKLTRNNTRKNAMSNQKKKAFLDLFEMVQQTTGNSTRKNNSNQKEPVTSVEPSLDLYGKPIPPPPKGAPPPPPSKKPAPLSIVPPLPINLLKPRANSQNQNQNKISFVKPSNLNAALAAKAAAKIAEAFGPQNNNNDL